MLRRAAVLLLACVPSGVMAKEARIGPVAVSLPPPPGYCEMDAAQAADARMLATVNEMLGATGNRLVVASAECKQLKEWRKGKRASIDNLAQYQTLSSLEEGQLSAPPEIAIKEMCDQMRAQAEQLMDDVAGNLRDRAEKAMQNVKFEDTKFLGVIAQEPLACYGGLLQKSKAEDGAERARGDGLRHDRDQRQDRLLLSLRAIRRRRHGHGHAGATENQPRPPAHRQRGQAGEGQGAELQASGRRPLRRRRTPNR